MDRAGGRGLVIDLSLDRALYPAPPSHALPASVLLARAERAEAEARGLRAEVSGLRVELTAVRLARDWWMRKAGS